MATAAVTRATVMFFRLRDGTWVRVVRTQHGYLWVAA